MMDFNQILLLVGLGLLVLVAIFALLGFLAGLKKELKCTAIAFVLLLLALLVFGDSSTLLNFSCEMLKGTSIDIPDSAKTMWDVVLHLVQTNVPNGAEIFVEGSKSYAFLYDVVAGVARGAMLIVGTLLIFIITLLVNIFYRIISRISTSVKKKKRAKAGIEEPTSTPDKNINDNVLVAQSENGQHTGSIITVNKTELEVKKSNHRGWAALLAAVRAVVVIMFIFAPISGICAVLDEVSPETEQLINETLQGDSQKTASSDSIVDIVMDFKDAYYDSKIGQFVESSSFFFGESVSTHLFDSAFTIKTATSEIQIRDEANVVIEAVNSLEGNIEVSQISKEQLSGALDALKDSELLVEAMPVAIEVVYELPIINGETLSSYLMKSSQQTAFLQLRQADWDKNLEILFDTVKEAYDLGVLKEDFNYLTMDPQELREVLSTLSKSDVVCNVLNIGVHVAINLDQVVEHVGKVGKIDLSSMDWAVEFSTIADIYDLFLDLGITSLDNIDANQLISDILNDPKQFDVVADMLVRVFSLQLVKNVGLEVAFKYVSKNDMVVDAGLDQVAAVRKLSEIDWEKDINYYLEAVKVALPMLDFSEGLVPKVDYLHLDVEILEEVVDLLFSTESFEKILPIGLNVALALPAVQEKLNEIMGDYKVEIDSSEINWKKDFTSLVSIYEEFLKLDIESIEAVQEDVLGLVKSIFDEKTKVTSLEKIVSKLPQLTLFEQIGAKIGDAAVKNLLVEKGFDGALADLVILDDLSVEQWQDDLKALVGIAEEVNAICGFDFKLESINFTEEGFEAINNVLKAALELNLLSDDNFKNTLLIEALKVTKLFSEEDIEAIDLSEVQWIAGTEENPYNELESLQALITSIYELQNREGINLNEVKFDLNVLLNSEEFMDAAVSTLEALVESKLVLELIPAALNKFVTPKLSEFDDEDGTLGSLVGSLESEELIEEVQKLIVAAKSAIRLGVFNVASDGIQAIKFELTDEMKTLVNALFDCKLIEGYESRLIRIVLKITKIFPDLEKGALDGIDYNQEQELLIQAIDALDVVLKDENFLVFKDGKIEFNKEFYLNETTLNAVINALDALFGEYVSSEEQTSGSQLIERLLPNIYDKYVAGLIPENFQEVVDILGLGDLDSATLASEIRSLVQIAEIAIEMKVQSYILEQDYSFAEALNGINSILDIVFEMHSVAGKESKVLAWALNYVQTTANLNITEFTEDDFANVDWNVEKTNIQNLIGKLIRLTNDNDISSVKKLIDFIKTKGYLSEDFLSDRNVNLAFEILEDVFSLQITESVVPFALEYALNIAKEKDFDVSFLGDYMTAEYLVEDLISIVDILRTAVYKLDLIEYRNANWTGKLPSITPVIEILDKLLALHLIDGKENQLLSFVVAKFLPANDYVKVSDLDFSLALDADAEFEVIKEVLVIAYDLFAANNINTLEDAISFFKEKQFTQLDILVKDQNVLIIADILEALADSQLVQQAAYAAIKNGVELDAIKNIGNFSALRGLTKPELGSDLKVVAEVIRLAVDANLLQYFHEKDIAPIDYNGLAAILETLGSMNLVNKYASNIIPEVLNYALTKLPAIKLNHEYKASEFKAINWQDELVLLGNVLVEVGEVFENANINSLSDILQFVNNKDYTHSSFLTEENVYMLLDATDLLLQSKLLASATYPAVDYLVELAGNKGYDISFISGRLTLDEFASDLVVISQILHEVVDFGAIEYLQTKDIAQLDVQPIVNIIASLEELNILTSSSPEWTKLVVEKLVDILKMDVHVLLRNYEGIDYAKENALLQEIVKEVGLLLENESLVSLKDVLSFVENIKLAMAKESTIDINIFNEHAVNNMQNILTLAVESDILGVHLVDLLEHGAKVATEKTNIDFSFVNGIFTRREIIDDVHTLVEISDYLIEAGLIDFLFGHEVVINVDPIVEVVKLLEEVNLLYKCNDYIAVIAYNKILPMLGIKEEVTHNDVMHINFAEENVILQEVLIELGKLLENENLTTVSSVINFIKNKDFLKAGYYETVYNDAAIENIKNIINKAVTSKLVQLPLMDLFNLGVDYIVKTTKLDVDFLKDSVTLDELVSDVPVILEFADYLIDANLLDYVFTKDFEINVEPIVNAVSLLESINLVRNSNTDFALLVYELALPKLGLDTTVELEDVAGINFANENLILQAVLTEVGKLLVNERLYTFSDVTAFINNKEYANKDNYKYVYNDAAIANVKAIINHAVTSELVQVVLMPLFDKGVDYASKVSKQDLAFLKGSVTLEELVSDVPVILNVADRLVEFGVIEYVFTKEIKVIDLDYVNEAIALFENINLLVKNNKKLTALVVNMILPRLGVKEEVVDTDFNEIDFAKENEILREVIYQLSWLQADFLLTSLSDYKEFIANKEYLEVEEFIPEVYRHAEALVHKATDSKVLQTVLPILLPLGIDYCANLGLDLTYLNGNVSGNKLADDIDTLVSEAIWWVRDGDILTAIKEKQFEVEHVERLVNIVEVLSDLNVIRDYKVEFTVAVTNFFAEKVMKYNGTVSADDFANVTDWTAEKVALQNVINELVDIVATFGVENDLLSLENLTEFAKGEFKNKDLYTNDLVRELADVLDALSESNLAASELVFLHEFAVSYLAARGTNIEYTLTDASGLQADLATLSVVLNNAADANVLGFAIKEEELNQKHVNKFIESVELLFDLNILAKDGAKEKVVDLVLTKLGVNVKYAKLYPVNWETEKANIVKLLSTINDSLVTLDLTTLPAIKAVNLKDYLSISNETNKHLYVASKLLKALAASELVEKLILPVSEKYLASEKLAGYADLHNIYYNGAQAVEDLGNLALVLEALIKLDVNNVVNNNGLIPYEETEAINTIIRKVFGLNYLNNKGRLDVLLAKVSKLDTSSIDTSNIDLVGDAELLVEMYAHLLTIVTDEEFMINRKSDLKEFTININYWLHDSYLDAAREALNCLLDTTLVTETNGAIFLLAIPLLERFDPELYAALDVERLGAEELSADFEALTNLVYDILDADLKAIVGGEYFSRDAEELIVNVISTLSNLNLLAGRGSAIANCLAPRYNGKAIRGYTFVADDYDFDSIDYYADAQVVIEMIHTVYDFFEREGIVSKAGLSSYISNAKASLRNVLAKQENIDTIEQLLSQVTELTAFKFNTLPAYNLVGKSIVARVFGETLADVSDVYDDSVAFYNDIVKGVELVSMFNEFGLASIMAGEEINYNQASLVKDILAQAASMEYVNAKFTDLVAFADSLVSSVDLSSIDFAAMDLDADFAIIGEIYEQLIPVLESEHNPISTIDDLKGLTIKTSQLYALIYDYQSIYPSVVELASEITIAPQLVKFVAEKVENRLGGTLGSLVSVLDITSMDDAELREDLLVVADILRDVESLDLLRYVLYKEDIAITDNAGISALVANVFRLHMVDNHFMELVETAAEKVLKVDLSNVDLSTVDVESEQALIVELVNDGVVIVNSLGVNNLSDVKLYIRNSFANVKQDVKDAIALLKSKQIKPAIKQALETVLAEARKVDTEKVVEAIEKACASSLVAKLVLPVYEQKVYTRLPGILAMVGDIHDYSEEQFAEDLSLVAEIARNVFDSKIYTVLTTKALPGEECIPYLENAVRAIANLNILEVKKQDIGPVLQAALDKVGLTTYIRKVDPDFDLAQFDADSISFANDAEIYVSMVPHAYAAVKGLLETGINASYFGNTEAMRSLIEIYTLSIETSIVEVFAPKALNIVSKVAAKFKCTVNENDKEVLYNISEFLFGLVELGVFSNNGIDFTKTAVIDSMVNNVYDSVTLPAKLQTVINKVAGRAYAYGVVPFDWTQISVKHEAKVAYDIAKLAVKFVRENASSIKALDLSILVDKDVQASLNEMIERVADSSFVEQLFFPFVEGTFKALTLGYTDGEMVYDATLDDVLATSLPNFWKVVDAVYEMTEFKPSNINRNMLVEFDAMADIVEVICNDIMIKDNIAKVLATAIGRFTSHDLTDEELAALLAIDYSVEGEYVIAALNKLQATYDATSFELNASAIKDPAVLKGFAAAFKEVLPSLTLEVLAKKVISIGNNKVIKKVLPAFAEVVSERLDDASYTNELVVADLYSLVDILNNVADSGVLANRSDFAAWNYDAIRNIIDLCYGTHLAQGYEAELTEAVIAKVPQINKYYDESIVIADWHAETLAIVNALESLVNDGITDLESFDIDAVSGTTVEYICESEILSKVLIDTINDKLEELEVSDYYVVTKAKIDLVQDWEAELDAIRDLTDLMDVLDGGSYELSDIVAQYRNIQNNTILVKDVLNNCAEYMVPKMPVVSDYYDESMNITDWEAELDAIVGAIEALDAKGLDSIENPLDNHSSIDGEIMLKLTASQILTEAIAQEINNGLHDAGLTGHDITASEVKDIDTEEAWEDELAALRELIDLKDHIDNKSIDEVVTAYDHVRATTLCNKILSAAAEEIVPELPIVSDYYDDSMNITDWNAELDAIVKAIEALDDKGLDSIENPLDNHSSIDGEIMLKLTASQILTEAIAQEINNGLHDAGLTGHDITASEVKDIDTEEAWEDELAALRELIDLKDHIDNKSIDEVVTAYDHVRATTLCNKILSASAEEIVPELPIVSDYYDDSMNITDWNAELDAIIGAIEALDAKGLDSIENPLDSHSSIDGDIMLKLTASQILTEAIAQEINNGLHTAGLTGHDITASEVKDIDTEEGWEDELAALRELVDLKDDMANKEVEDVIDTYNTVRATVLCNKVLTGSAEEIVPELPIVKNYYSSSMNITDWNAELDAIIDVFEALDAEDITSMENPIENLNGHIIMLAFESTIITHAFNVEFNNNLTALGLSCQVNESELRSVNSESAWDKELAAILTVKDLVDDISAGTATLVEVQIVYNQIVTETEIAEKVLIQALDDAGFDLSLL